MRAIAAPKKRVLLARNLGYILTQSKIISVQDIIWVRIKLRIKESSGSLRSGTSVLFLASRLPGCCLALDPPPLDPVFPSEHKVMVPQTFHDLATF